MEIKKKSEVSALEEIKHILVVGLGKSGLSCIDYLTKQIKFKKKLFKISVYDKNKTVKEQRSLLKDLDIKEVYSGDIKFEFIDKKSHVFLSPGVSPAEVNKFNQKFSIINDISLFLEHLSDNSNNLKVIGITGTNGKTTTCLFLEHLLIKAGYKARASGNIGNSPLDLIGKLESLEVVVLEISSFQLNPFKKNGFPGKKIDVGVFLNFTEDHLDMHVSIDDYLQSKLALLKSSKRHVINQALMKKIPKWFKDITFMHSDEGNIKNECSDEISQEKYVICSVEDSKFIINNNNFKVCIKESKLLGNHNELNIAAAFAAFRCLDISFSNYQDVIKSFNGAPHRIEWIRDVNGIKFYNDSKATNVASTIAALQFFKDKNIFLIAGGDSKRLSMEPLKRYLNENVSHLFLIGKDALVIKKIFVKLNNLKISICKDLTVAVSEAFDHATVGDIILLSPSCSSHDMYQNYIERGEHFNKIVRSLKN
jgi:UDP-N-acetylmuramoylalanine--D-glutamate ligase